MLEVLYQLCRFLVAGFGCQLTPIGGWDLPGFHWDSTGIPLGLRLPFHRTTAAGGGHVSKKVAHVQALPRLVLWANLGRILFENPTKILRDFPLGCQARILASGGQRVANDIPNEIVVDF